MRFSPSGTRSDDLLFACAWWGRVSLCLPALGGRVWVGWEGGWVRLCGTCAMRIVRRRPLNTGGAPALSFISSFPCGGVPGALPPCPLTSACCRHLWFFVRLSRSVSSAGAWADVHARWPAALLLVLATGHGPHGEACQRHAVAALHPPVPSRPLPLSRPSLVWCSLHAAASAAVQLCRSRSRSTPPRECRRDGSGGVEDFWADDEVTRGRGVRWFLRVARVKLAVPVCCVWGLVSLSACTAAERERESAHWL